MIRQFTDLFAWQAAHAMVLRVYTVTKSFPRDELFGLASQSRRASVSVSANIAEGFGRTTKRDKQHFYAMARGSLNELHNHCLIARDLGYIPHQVFDEMSREFDQIGRLVTGLQRAAVSRE